MINGSDRYVGFTSEFFTSDINKLPEDFKPTLFQELIEKKYEIRTFFLDGQLSSMCIFSQEDSKTNIDFRNYNFSKPNRRVPYSLPEEISIKLKDLFSLLDLNTGSVDLIKDKKGNYIFLEINSIGQFGMTSHPCNYSLEKQIAQHLINLDNE